MSDSVNFLVICGSLRTGSFNRMIVNTLPELCPDNTFEDGEVNTVDLLALLSMWGPCEP